MVFSIAHENKEWRDQLETAPGNDLKNVKLDQWFYRMDDGAVMIRTAVITFGFFARTGFGTV